MLGRIFCIATTFTFPMVVFCRLLKKSLFNELNYFAVRVFAFKILFLLADVFFTKLIEDVTVL